MSGIVEQQLSAFLDGELPAEELDLLLARLDGEPGYRATLARYAMIGECVRSGTAVPMASGTAERVRAALLESHTGQAPRRKFPSSRGMLAGAAAAVVAVAVVVMGGPRMWGLSRQEPVAREPAAVQLMDEPLSAVSTSANRRLSPGAAARLTSYLVAHGQYANQLSRSTFDSHLVTARAERASWRQPADAVSAP